VAQFDFFIIGNSAPDPAFWFLKNLPLILIVLLPVLLSGSFLPGVAALYFLPPWKFSSYPPGTPDVHFVDKFVPRIFQDLKVFVLYASVFPNDPDHTVVTVLNVHVNEAFFSQRSDISSDLPFADTEELGEMTVGRITTIFIVQA